MKEETARTVANVILGAAVVGAAVVVLRVPALRRMAFGLIGTALTTQLPGWLSQEATRAWHRPSTRPVQGPGARSGQAPGSPGLS